MTKTARLAEAFSNGEELTAKQIASRFGFPSTGAVRATISNLRFSGMPIYSNERTNSKGKTLNKYRLGTPSKAVIAAGYRALAGQHVVAV
jgi:predicted ArsR family transcriptional regulator